MKHAYEEGGRTPAQLACTGDEFPFIRDGDITHLKYTRTLLQHAPSYRPILPGTEDGRRTGHYLVEQTVAERVSPGRVKFTATYANIPSTRSTAGSTQFTRPSLVALGLIGSTATTPANYGSAESGDAGLIVPIGSSRTYNLYVRHGVATDTGIDNTPTGGTWTLTVAGFGTTAPLAYNATASQVRDAILALDSTLNVSVNTAPAGFDYDFQLTISAERAALSKVSGTGMEAGAIYPHLFALAMPSRGTATLEFVDVDLTSTPELVPGGIDYRELLPVEVGKSSIYGAVYSYTFAPSDPRSVRRHYTGGRITGGHIKAVLGGTATASIEVIPGNLEQTRKNINDALSLVAGVDAHEFVGRVSALEAYFDGLKLTENTYANLRKWGLGLGVNNEVEVVISREPWYRPPTTVRHVPMPRLAAPSAYSYKATIDGDEVTFDQDDEREDIENGLASLPYYSAAGIAPKLTTYEKTEYGVMFTIAGLGVGFTAASSLTPGPSAVHVNGPQINLVANVTARVITTSRPHGLKTGDRIFIKRGGVYEFPETAPFTVTGDSEITVENTAAPWRDSTLITELGQFVTRYQPGAAMFNTRTITEYYLPGVTPGIASAEDISVKSATVTDEEFVRSHFTGTSAYLTTQAGELEYYLGPILSQTYTQIKIR